MDEPSPGGLPLASFAQFEGTERFEIMRRLGAGGMGVVFEARDRERRARVAIKTLHNLDAQSLYRLKREFRALHDLQHVNLVRLGELIEHRGLWFFTMELVDGVDFLRHVRPAEDDIGSRDTLLPVEFDADTKPEGPPVAVATLDEGRLRRCLVQLARALDAIHAAGKVHRDIKPSNVIVTPSERLVVLDFGLVTESADERSSTEVNAVGTAVYMAPEQAASRAVTPSADWYSVGVMLYEALTGRAPFSGRPLEVMLDKHRRAPEPPSTHAEVSAELEALCMRLLDTDPEARPGAAEVLRILGASEDTPLAVGSQPASQPTHATGFVGRTSELAELATAYADTRSDRAVTVMVRGASGLGKSSLLRNFAATVSAEDERVVVLSGRCYERETVPYKAFDGLIDALSSHLRRMPKVAAAELVPRNAALLPRAFPVLGRVEVIAEAPRRNLALDPQQLRTRIFRALRDLLTLLTERAPLILVIDDLQWADAESLALMRELMSEPDPPALLLLLSARDAVAPPELPGDLRIIELGPLEDSAAHQLATSLIQRARVGGRISADAIASEAAGHPMYIDELVRHASIVEAPGARALRLDDAIWKRAVGLGPEAVAILRLVCVAGAPLPEAVIRDAARAAPAEFDRQISLLRVAHLVRYGAERDAGRVEPYHDRVREAALQRLDEDERASIHASLAAALRGTELAMMRPELLVRHLAGAGQAAEAARQAVIAARRADDALAFDQAARLYGKALRLGSFEGEEQLGLRASMARSLATAGRCAEAADQFIGIAEAAGERAARLEYLSLAAENLLIAGYIDRGLEVVHEVLAIIGGRLPRTPRRALISLLWHRAKLRVRGLSWTRRSLSDIPRTELLRQDAYKAISHGLGLADNILGRDFQARCLLLALDTGEETRIAAALCYESCFLSSEGSRKVPRARALIDRASELAQAHDDDFLRAWVQIAEGYASYFSGAFVEAVRAHERAEALLVDTPASKWWELDSSRLCRIFALRHLGRFQEIGRLYERYARDARQRGDRYMETSLTRYCSVLSLVAGDPDDGERRLAWAEWTPPDGVFHLQHWFELEARAECALFRDQAGRALVELAPLCAALERSLLLRAQIVRSIYRWLQARLAIAAATSPEEITVACKRALAAARALDREGVPYAAVWAALLRASVAHHRRGRDEACAHFEEAERLAHERQMGMCAAAAQRRRGELLGGAGGAALVAEADGWMAGEGVRAPEDMARVYVPVLPGA